MAARTEVVTDGRVVESALGNPLDFIAQYQQRFKVALTPGLPRFCGGLAGYFGYDAVRYIEKKLENTCPPDELAALPPATFDLVTSMEVVEHVTDPAAFIAELAARLAPGGLMILSTPNRTALSKLLLVEAAERLGIRGIVSIDADFDVYRDARGKPLANLLRS